MKKILVAALLTLSAPAALADAPGQGDIGLNFSLSAAPVNSTAVVAPGLGAEYWFLDQLSILGRFNFATQSNVGTSFALLGGADYYLVKKPSENYGLFVGALLGFDVTSPSGGNSSTGFDLQAGGGADYYFSKHFSVRISEGLALATAGNTLFYFTTNLGLNVYF